MRTKIKLITEKDIDTQTCIKGWVRSIRISKNFAFIAVNDGSCFNSIQVVADAETSSYPECLEGISTGAAVSIEGLVVKSPGKEQAVEIKASNITLVGACDAETYPLQKKRHSFEFLRTIAHLRPRTNTQGAVLRVRNALSFATHKFFQEQGFVYIHSPILTASDCEGAGEMFTVSNFDLENPPKKDGKIDYTQDFFGKHAFLTVSGQLEAEIAASALSDVYTFGPTFRAENSNTPRHLAEFWMIEPELSFADLNDDMTCAENYVQYCIKYVLEHCEQDIGFFSKFIDKTLLKRLQSLAEATVHRVSYTDAINILQKSGKKFEYPVEWGLDLQTEHERFLSEQHFNGPVTVHDYPKIIKSFYMRINDDQKTVAAMDMLVPGVGELIGGSQREERLDVLDARMAECGLNKDEYWWYRELRMYGSVPHAGFGLGFERLVQFTTGMENIRDVIPFPRHPKHIDF